MPSNQTIEVETEEQLGEPAPPESFLSALLNSNFFAYSSSNPEDAKRIIDNSVDDKNRFVEAIIKYLGPKQPLNFLKGKVHSAVRVMFSRSISGVTKEANKAATEKPLNHTGIIDNLNVVMQKHAQTMTSKILNTFLAAEKQGAKEAKVNIGELFQETALNIIFEYAFGSLINFDDPSKMQLADAATKLMGAINHIVTKKYPIFFSITKKDRDVFHEIDGARFVFEEYINLGITNYLNLEAQGIVNEDSLIAHLITGYKRHNIDKDFTDELEINKLKDFVYAQIFVTLLAGNETTATIFPYIFKLLGSEKNKESKKYLDECNLNDSENDFVDAVIKESLRMEPPIKKFERITNKAMRLLNGLFIPPGSPVALKVTAYTRNKTLFSNPNKFDPFRFLPANETLATFFKTQIFGSGKYGCPGTDFALTELKIVLRNMLMGLKVEGLSWEYGGDKGKIVGITDKLDAAMVTISRVRPSLRGEDKAA